jgi:hypothetical protein
MHQLSSSIYLTLRRYTTSEGQRAIIVQFCVIIHTRTSEDCLVKEVRSCWAIFIQRVPGRLAIAVVINDAVQTQSMINDQYDLPCYKKLTNEMLKKEISNLLLDVLVSTYCPVQTPSNGWLMAIVLKMANKNN